LGKGLHQIPRKNTQTYSLFSLPGKVLLITSRFEKDLERNRLGEFESLFNVRGDLIAEGEIVVGKKEGLDRSRNIVPLSRIG
jgi:hypothetical protein